MIRVGDTIGSLIGGLISRQLLALYAGASGDRKLLHIDLDYARGAGRDDVIAHGMLSMAWISRLLIERFGPQGLRHLETRSLAPAPVHATVRFLGEVATVVREGELTLVGIDVRAELQDGTLSALGAAKRIVSSED